MIRIVFLAPFEELKELAEQVFAEGSENDRSDRSYDFQAILAPTTSHALSQDLNADVIIARGATAFDLKRQGFPVPIVELVISGEDMLNVLFMLKERYGQAPAGIIGSVNMILGVQIRLYRDFSPGYGFDGIAVALLGNNTPIGMFISAVMFGILRAGSNMMQMMAKVPSAMIRIIQGLIIIFVVASKFFGVMQKRYAIKREAKRS